jgi:adenine-specific DNA-methyltransferase
MDIKKQRGQFFTTKEKVLNVLVSLIENEGEVFEPSAGSGHIISSIEQVYKRDIYACELDSEKVKTKVCESEIIVSNFFDYIKNNKKYPTVIGNPPFVKLKNVEMETLDLLPEKIKGNGNLYYLFIKYCIEVLEGNGELIFIVPKEWLYNTSSQFLRDFLKINGDFTHFIDCGEEKLFDDADVPALCIFRYQKGYVGKTKYYHSIEDYNSNTYKSKKTIYGNTVSFVTKKRSSSKISDFFDVKVGLVTGYESVFKLPYDTNLENECIIEMITTSKTLERYLFLDNFSSVDVIPSLTREYILLNKENLLKRKIKKFSDKNWWHYGALRNLELMRSDKPRIYGLMKTRDLNPFWVGAPNTYFSGGVFALFLKNGVDLGLQTITDYLNSSKFKQVLSEANMYSNNKVSFTSTAFSSLPFEI